LFPYSRYSLYYHSFPTRRSSDLQLPDEIAYFLEDDHAVNRLKDDKSGFMVTGYFKFSDGTEETISRDKIDYQPGNFVSIDPSTNSIIFDMTGFLEANELELTDNPTLTFDTPFALEYGNMPANGTYPVKTAFIAESANSANIDDVNNHYSA